MYLLNGYSTWLYYFKALLKYVEFIQNIVFAPSSLKVVYTGGEQTTLIGI